MSPEFPAIPTLWIWSLCPEMKRTANFPVYPENQHHTWRVCSHLEELVLESGVLTDLII